LIDLTCLKTISSHSRHWSDGNQDLAGDEPTSASGRSYIHATQSSWCTGYLLSRDSGNIAAQLSSEVVFYVNRGVSCTSYCGEKVDRCKNSAKVDWQKAMQSW